MPVLIVAILVLYVAGPNRTQTNFIVALSLTGWAPAYTWEDGLRATIEWFATNRDQWIGRVDW